MHNVSWPLEKSQCLLLLNGDPRPSPLELYSHVKKYETVIACDGAWNSCNDNQCPSFIEYVTVVMGDGDSVICRPESFITLADQNFTDFEKALQHIISHDITSVDVYWSSGGEMDHFLGNLSVAAKYHDHISIRFYDAHQCYWFVNTDCNIRYANTHQVSIYPFPEAIVSSRGFRYEMTNFSMKLNTHQSLRNVIASEDAHLTISGAAFIFIALQTDT